MIKVQRWVSLKKKTDDRLREEAEKESRSIANMLNYIVTQYLDGK
jgi:hypothetical protein